MHAALTCRHSLCPRTASPCLSPLAQHEYMHVLLPVYLQVASLMRIAHTLRPSSNVCRDDKSPGDGGSVLCLSQSHCYLYIGGRVRI